MVRFVGAAVLAAFVYAVPALAAEGDRAGPSHVDIVDPQRFGQKTPDAAYGAFQRGLYITALNLGLARAQKGDAAAQTLVAEIYSRGLGVRRDPAAAAEWYGKAAEQGVPEAQLQYALVLMDGKYASQDKDRAYELLGQAADAGNRLAMFNYAQMTIEREPGPSGLDKAIDYYEKAAELGLADAQYAMAQVLARGTGGRMADERAARTLLAKAARQNYDTAQVELATWLVEGRGGPRDYETGFRWMKLAANGGNVAAQSRLAKLYWQGLGTEPDSIEAAAWYILARRAGLKDPVLNDLLAGLTAEEQKEALERANRLR
ncbi:tetratricopeptide repeat protein [Mesorhizobium xinjiangense]|uniref:tetratricopeptide repeat protein n=1 Tax=Mesorhizobium xinjiangense TaxID=2678685 RepID=UPI0018DD8BE7